MPRSKCLVYEVVRPLGFALTFSARLDGASRSSWAASVKIRR